MALSWLEESAKLSSAFITNEVVNGEIPLQEYGAYPGSNFFKKTSTSVASDFSHNTGYAEEVLQLNQIPPSPLAFLLSAQKSGIHTCIHYITYLCMLFLTRLHISMLILTKSGKVGMPV
jgi:hypothetical protein